MERYAKGPAATDHFAGYAVIGLPFQSGHVLALRRFPESSIGPGYTSVWHRDPDGAWTFYSTIAPELGCARYFGREIAQNVVAPIEIEWQSPAGFTVNIGTTLCWTVNLTESLSTRFMNRVAALLPAACWSWQSTLTSMGAASRLLLGTGRMNFSGKTPNGHEFIANPQRVWLIDSSFAILNGSDLGPTGPLKEQAHLNDLLIPQRGVFAVVRAFLKPSGVTVLDSSPATPVLTGH